MVGRRRSPPPGPRVKGHKPGLYLLLAAALPLAGLYACGGPGAALPTALPLPAPTPTPSPSPVAVVISVDGLRPDVFRLADFPSINALSRRGAYTWKAQTVFPPTTLPSHASMLSGMPPSAHRLTWNDFQPERGFIAVPTVFSIAKAAGLRTVMVVGKEKLRHLAAAGTVDSFVLTGRGDQDVANEALVQVQAGFDLMFVHFPETDITGHQHGWLSPSYVASVADLDRALGRLLSALPPHATVILSADHGGRGVAHGYNIPEDMTIPWIVAGPRVVAGRELARSVSTMDTAATALHVLGLALPPGASGSVVTEALASPAP